MKDGAAKLGVNPGLLLGGVVSVAFLIIMLLKGWLIIMTFITVLYPAVHSIRAIESESEDDDKVWLSYWMVFGVLNVLETFFGFIFWLIPYWGWIRLGLFGWLLLGDGSRTIYKTGLKPIMVKNEALIKDMIEKIKSASEQAAAEAKKAAKDAANDPSVIAKAANAANVAQRKLGGDDDDVVEASN